MKHLAETILIAACVWLCAAPGVRAQTPETGENPAAAPVVQTDPETGAVKALITGRPIGELAVAELLDVELHAEFMAARTQDDARNVLNWYNLGYSGGGEGGRESRQGGTFGNFGLDVSWRERAKVYPTWAPAGGVPAVHFNGANWIKSDFPAENGVAGDETFTIEVWARNEQAAPGETILGWQSANGAETSASMLWPESLKGSEEFRHIVLVADADAETLYVDGEEFASGPRTTRIAEGHVLLLGGASQRSPAFSGEIAAVRVHRGVLDAAGVARNAEGGVMLGTKLFANVDPDATPEQGYQYDTWSDADPEDYLTKTSAHFRYRIPNYRIEEMTEQQRTEHAGRLPGMFQLAEACYRCYSEIHALRMPLVSAKPEFRGDGVKYLIHIAPSDGGSWMGWHGELGFGYPMQGPGHVNPHELVHGVQAQTGGGMQGNYWEVHANFPQTWIGVWQSGTAGVETRDQALFEATGRSYYDAHLMMRHLAETPEYGPMFISKIWYAGATDAYPWISFKRFDPDPSTSLGYEWARMVQRNVTWDYPMYPPVMEHDTFNPDRFRDQTAKGSENYEMVVRHGRINLYEIPAMPGWLRPAKDQAPQQTGWNLIPLAWEAGPGVSAELAGWVDPERGSNWHYGFVAVDAEGESRYGDVVSGPGTASFDMEDGDRELYLAVAAIPEEVMPINMVGDVRAPEQEQFPYRVRFENASPRNLALEYYQEKFSGMEGAPHPNGGGFVAATAKVAETAFVGPGAWVVGDSTVGGHARIEDHGVVENATVEDYAIVSGFGKVSQGATVKDYARVRDFAEVGRGANLSGHAKVVEHGILETDQPTSGRVTIKGHAIKYGGKGSGTAILDGNYAKANDIDKGKWFSWSWGMGQNPGEVDADFHGLYARYSFENPHPVFAWDDHGITWGYLHGAPQVREFPERVRHESAVDVDQIIDTLNPEPNAGEQYGQQITAYFHPPKTGEYTFWLCCDDAGELWLGTDPAAPEALDMIAEVIPYTMLNVWDAQTSQRSDPVRLEAGKSYPIRAMHKEGGGGDHLQVAYTLDGDERVFIEGDMLSVTPDGPRGRARQQIWYGIESDQMAALYEDPRFPDGTIQIGGRALVLNGRDQFVELQADVADQPELVVEASVQWDGGAANQRLFDFGAGDGDGIYLTPSDENGKLALVTVLAGERRTIEAGEALPAGEWKDVSVVIAEDGARLLVDGEVVGENEAIVMRPFLEGARGFTNVLGASQQAGDLFAGKIEDFAIYNLAPQDPAEVAAR